MKELLNDKKRLLLIGGMVLLVIIAIVLVVSLRSHSNTVKYENFMTQAQTYMDQGNYDKAVSLYEQAYARKDTDECAIALARAYAAAGDVDKAEELLLDQIQHSKGSAETKLKNVLKEILNGSADGEETDGILIAGDVYVTDATAVIVEGKTLSEDDLDAICSLTELTTLSLKNCGLKTVSFLKDCTGLTSLTLSGNDISDLSPLKNLKDLRTLYLDGNPVEDFSPLYKLSGLTTLSIKDIEITQSQYDELAEKLDRCSIYSDDTVAEEITLGGVTFQSDVTELDLTDKGIRDISDLAKCTQLQTLNLKGNQISDLSPLEGLENLTWLCLWDNDISDVSPLGVLTQLTYLDLEDNDITNINALSSLTNLTELYLDDNDISSFNALSGMKSLRKLGLRDTGLTDKTLGLLKISTLAELDISENPDLTGNAVKDLKTAIPKCTVIHDELTTTVTLGSKTFESDATLVDASNAGVTDLSELSKCTAVTSLMLNNNAISDFSPLTTMTELTVLELGNTGASDITFLAGHSKLTNLNLARNQLKDVYALSSCTGLIELLLSDNTELKDIAPLAYCARLTDLYLENTGVTDVSALAKCTKLTNLYLDGCQLADPTQLHALTSLKTLSVVGCGLSQTQIDDLKTALPGCAVYA